MKATRRKSNTSPIFAAVFFIAAAIGFIGVAMPRLMPIGESAAVISAALNMPDVGLRILKERFGEDIYYEDQASSDKLVAFGNSSSIAESRLSADIEEKSESKTEAKVEPTEEKTQQIPKIKSPDIPIQYRASIINENFSGQDNTSLIKLEHGYVKNDTNESDSYIREVLEQDFDFDIILSVNGRQQRDYAMSFSGTFANPVMEVYADTDYADISDGYVVEAMEYVRAIDLDVGDGVLVHTKLSKGRKYYGVAHHIPYDDADAFMKAHPTVVEAITLKTVGLANAASTVTLGDGLGAYHVYNKDGEYLGLGSDELIYADTYYLSKEKLEIAEPEAPAEPIPSDTPSAPPEPEPVPVADSYPPNVNYNPYTGGC